MTKGAGPRGRGDGPGAAEAARRLLAARALSVAELRARLASRGYAGVAIDGAIRSLEALGALDDRSLAYNVAISLAARRRYGRARVAAELRRRGLADEAVGPALERAFAEHSEDELALAAARRLGPVPQGPEARRVRGRIARALARKGLPGGVVARALSAVAATSGGDDRELDLADDDLEVDP